MKKSSPQDLLAKVLNPAELVQYQAGSIVSKIILDKKTGTVTLFAFAKGQRLSEHAAPFDALVQVVEGTGEIFIGQKPHVLNAGEMIIMPAHIPHAVNARKKFKMLLIMIRSN